MKVTKIIALALTIITASSCNESKKETTSKKDLEAPNLNESYLFDYNINYYE